MKKLFFIGVVVGISNFGMIQAVRRTIDITISHTYDHKKPLLDNMQCWLDAVDQAKCMAKKKPGIIIKSDHDTLIIKNSSMNFAKRFLNTLNYSRVNSLQVIERNE